MQLCRELRLCPEDCGACEGSCCFANDTSGCEDQEVTACVCGIDTACCEVAWDDSCVVNAHQCGSCDGECCEAHDTPGCKYHEVELCVCDLLGASECCTDEWTEECVTLGTSPECETACCGDGVCEQEEGCYPC